MADKHAIDRDADGVERLDVHVGLGPIDTTTWKQPPPPDPCACPVVAVHRLGVTGGAQGVGLGSLPPGSVTFPPLAQLYLPPGNYVVSANFSVSNNSGASGMLFAYLGTPSQGNMSWTWLRVPSHGAPGDGQIVHLQGVLTLAAGDWLGVDASGGAHNNDFLAYDIWLIAQRVGVASVQTI